MDLLPETARRADKHQNLIISKSSTMLILHLVNSGERMSDKDINKKIAEKIESSLNAHFSI